MKLALQLRPYVIAAQVVAHAALAFRLYSTGLYRIYKWFFAYILFEGLRVAVMGSVDIQTDLYAELYFVSQPITWCLYLFILLELNQLALRNHPGIATMARKFIAGAIVLSTAVSLTTLLMNLQSASTGSQFIATYVLIERLILSSLLVLLLLLTIFLAYFPVPVNRNIVIHGRIFAVFFFVKTVMLLFRNLIAGEMVYTLNLALQGFSILCLAAWTLLLSPAGESTPTPSSRWRDPDSEDRVLAQLEAINRTLTGSAKRT